MKSCSSCKFLGEHDNGYHCKAMSSTSVRTGHPDAPYAPVNPGSTWGDLPYFDIEDPEEFGCLLHPDNELEE